MKSSDDIYVGGGGLRPYFVFNPTKCGMKFLLWGKMCFFSGLEDSGRFQESNLVETLARMIMSAN